MPLQWNKIEVPFGFGIDETAHRFIQAPPGLAQLVNGRWDKDGQLNFREGYDAIAQAPGQPLWLFKYNESLYCTFHTTNGPTDTVVHACAVLNKDASRFDQQGGFTPTQALTEATILERLAVARDTTWDQGDSGTVGVTGMSGFDFTVDESSEQIVIAWVQMRTGPAGPSPRIYAVVLDSKTRAVIKPVQEVSTGPALIVFCTHVKVIKQATTVHVVYSTGAGEVRTKDYNLSTRAWGADTAVVVDLNLNPTWDAAEAGDNFWVLVYRNTTPRVASALVNGATVISSTTFAEDPTSIGICVNATTLPSGVLWIGYFLAGTGMRALIYDLTFAVLLVPTTVEALATLAGTIAICEVSSTKALYCWTTRGTATTRTTTKFRTVTTAGALGTQVGRYSTKLASKPVVYAAVVYCNLLYSGITGVSPVLFTVALVGATVASTPTDVMSFRNCAVWMQGFAGYVPMDTAYSIGSPPCTFRHIGSLGEHWFPALERLTIRNETVDGQMTPHIFGKNGVDLCRVDLADHTLRSTVECGNNVIFAGAKTQLLDGSHIADHGMYYPPEDALGTPAGGGSLTAGSYQIALVWQFETEHGILRSPPMFVNDSVTGEPLITVAGGQQINVTLPPLNITQMFAADPTVGLHRAEAVSAYVYRTEANGSILYLDTTVANDVFGTAAAPMTFSCSRSDADLKDNAEIYTTGGILPSWPLPACDHYVLYKNRIFGIQSEDKKQLVFTQFLQDGEVPQWHPFLAQRIDDDGPCTGLAVMDDNLIVFKSDAIYIMRGNGPDRKGLNSDYIISKVNSPHGCIERRSIVVDPRGVAFRSRLGMMRMTRQFQVEYFGVKIEDQLGGPEDTTIVGVAALPNYVERIYWLMQAADGSGGEFIVYQWSNDQWAIDAITSDEEGTLNPRSMVWVGGVAYACFTTGQNVYAHRGNEDPFDVYELIAASNWFKFSGPQGFKRIRNIEILGEHKDNHDIKFDLYRDYNETAAFQTVIFEDADLAALDPYQLKLHVAEQRCESLRFVMTVTPTPSDGFQSDVAAFVGMAFDVGIKPTMMRLPNAAMRG